MLTVHRWLVRTTGAAAAAGLLFASTTSAAVIHFQQGVAPSAGYTADSTYLRGDDADRVMDNDDGNGDIAWNLVGFRENGGSDSHFHSLYEFDLSEIINQAGGSPMTINSVTFVQRAISGRDATPQTAGDNPMTVVIATYDFVFDESTATWNNPAPGDTTPGGTIGTDLTQFTNTVPKQNAGDPATDNTWTFPDTAAFQAAVAAALAAPDHTLRLIAYQPDIDTSVDSWVTFAEEELDAGDPGIGSSPPELVVDYTIIPEPTTLALLGLGGLAWLRDSRRRARRGDR